MKKLITNGIILLLLLNFTNICYAGSIPEDLLGYDYSQVYFGEVVKIDGESITVIQRQNIKGEFEEGNQITYSDYAFTQYPKAGQIYLCGYFDENNPLYVWETTSFHTKTLKIKNKDELSKRMQKYLNDGLFDEKEQERINQIDAISAEQASNRDVSDYTDHRNIIIGSLIFVGLAVITIVLIKGRRRRNKS